MERKHLRLLPLDYLIQQRDILNEIIAEKQRLQSPSNAIMDCKKISKSVRFALADRDIYLWTDFVHVSIDDLERTHGIGKINQHRILEECKKRGIELKKS